MNPVILPTRRDARFIGVGPVLRAVYPSSRPAGDPGRVASSEPGQRRPADDSPAVTDPMGSSLRRAGRTSPAAARLPQCRLFAALTTGPGPQPPPGTSSEVRAAADDGSDMSDLTAPAASTASAVALLRRPRETGLYDPALEHDACGVAFVVDMHGRRSPRRSSRQGLDRAAQPRPPRRRRRRAEHRRRRRHPDPGPRRVPARRSSTSTCRRPASTPSASPSCPPTTPSAAARVERRRARSPPRRA